MKYFSSGRALISKTIVCAIPGMLALLVVGPPALAQVLPGTPCPPGFTCLSPEPRDGACRHPELVVDTKLKTTRYEGDGFSRAYEKACIAQANSSAVRRSLELRLKFGNGASKVYKDNFAAAACEKHFDSCKQYVLYDYFPEHGLFLVHLGYNEGQEWFLVRQTDGQEQQIVAPPGYSPGKKWLAAVYATDGGDDGNNGVDIVPADLNPAEAGFHYRPEEYEIWEFVRWDGDDRLSLKVTRRIGSDPELVTRPAEVVRINDKWQLNK